MIDTLYSMTSEGVCVHELIHNEAGEPCDYRILDVNAAFERITGLTRKQSIGALASDLYGSSTAPYLDVYARVVTTSEPSQFETYFAPMDKHFTISARSPQPGRFVTVFTDITEIKRAEAASRESAEKLAKVGHSTEYLERIFNLSGYMVCVATMDGYFKKVSVAFEETLGYTEQELLERPFLDLVHPEDRETTLAVMERELAKGTLVIAFENRYLCKDGSCKWLRWTSRPVVEEGLLFAIAYDVTEHKQSELERQKLEKQVQYAQKLESLGVLAGGIAHDFNNMLMGILGNADLALDSLPPHSPARKDIEEVQIAAKRAADLARQMLAYSGKGNFFIEPVALNDLVTEMGNLLTASISKKVSLQRRFHEVPTFQADATQIRQIVMNLITNASEAIGEQSGVIGITTGVMACDESYLSETYLNDDLAKGPYVFLEVTDNGCGMSEETRAKVFDPFFTTKFTGRGLGMSAVLGIVRGHKGAIKIDSEVGKGTSFKVLFPACELGEQPAATTAPRDSLQGGGTVLLVDDDPTIRRVGQRMLTQKGFDVVTATDGRQAIEVFSERADEIACVILDLTMPQMDGEQTFREMQRIDPDVKIVISSGYCEQDATKRFVGKGLAGFLQKPYKMDTLTAVLSKALTE